MAKSLKFLAARVLVDVIAHGLKAGQIVEADEATIKVLKESGAVDPHEDAVAYAREQGAKVVRVERKKAPEPKQSEALQTEIAELEKRLGEAADDAKPDLQTALDAKRAELAALTE